LNERHYGSLQGLKKDDPDLIKMHGAKQMEDWRRSFEARPPPMDETHPFWEPPPAPLTESLQDCLQRTSKFYDRAIKPRLLNGDKVLVVAHANTIRALVKKVDDISDENIRDLRIPNSIPLVYRLHGQTLEPCK
jgi:2,3-bisphosphoglycerate-dependent phosphoglycerate mutase